MKKLPKPPTGTKVARNLGKNSVHQDLGSPHSGMKSSVTPGDPMSRVMGQLGKGHSFAPPAPMRTTTMVPHPRKGGLGPGAQGTDMSSGDYQMVSPDTEV